MRNAGRITELADRSEYREEDIRDLVGVFTHQDAIEDPTAFLDMFDRLPEPILVTLASGYSDDFRSVMANYVGAIDAEVGDRPFVYAERVARKMTLVFREKRAPARLRAMAVEAVLIAAVRLNRFAAMDAFDEMLTGMTTDELAFEVRDMLEDRESEYRVICGHVPALRLHPAIRGVRNRLARSE